MEITRQDGVLQITEEELGWDKFTDEMERRLPNIPKNWWQKVARPAFETNFTTIYKRPTLQSLIN